MKRVRTAKVVIGYAVVAALWILLSDEAVLLLGLEAKPGVTYSIVKGLLFVAVTSVVLSSLLTRSMREVECSERALRASESRYRTLVDSLDDIVWETDAQGRFIYVSRSVRRILGYEQAEVIGERMVSFTAEAEREAFAAALQPAWEAGEPVKLVQTVVARADGSLVQLQFNAMPVRAEDGTLAGYRGVSRDITADLRLRAELDAHRQHLEEMVDERTVQLRALNERLREATEAKSAFLATMSHELRTPLNAIIGFTAILRKELAGPLNAEQHKQLDMAYTAGQHLLELINDTLDLSRIEAGRLDLSPAPVAVGGIVSHMEGIMRPLAEDKRLSWAAECDDPTHVLVTDARRVEQVLFNLIGNAVKFTDHGTVSLKAYREGDMERFEVRDTGRGMDPGRLEGAFDEFVRLEESGDGVGQGTGLGLPIARRLAIALGGHLSGCSELGVGSTFTLEIPVSTDKGAAQGLSG